MDSGYICIDSNGGLVHLPPSLPDTAIENMKHKSRYRNIDDPWEEDSQACNVPREENFCGFIYARTSGSRYILDDRLS